MFQGAGGQRISALVMRCFVFRTNPEFSSSKNKALSKTRGDVNIAASSGHCW